MEELEMNKGTWSERSESIVNIAKALCNTQATVEAVKKDAVNPFFKSKYADLASIWSAIREALTSNGLSVLQEPSTEGNKVRITTTLIHTSGEYVRSTLEVVAVKVDPQGIGSAITYARRYALGAIVGIAPEDEDGNAASGVGDKKYTPKQNPQVVVPNLQTADQVHNDKVFNGDDLSFTSNGKPDMATAQTVKKGGAFEYNLLTYFQNMAPKEATQRTLKLQKMGGVDLGDDKWVLPAYVEGLAQYLVPENSGEVAA